MAGALSSSSTYVQSHAAWVLAVSAQHPQLSAEIASSPAALHLLALMAARENAHEVSARAGWAIAELADSSSSSREAFARLGAMPQLSGLIRDRHDALTATAVGAMASLTQHQPANSRQAATLLTSERMQILLQSSLCEVRAQAARLVANIVFSDPSLRQQYIAAGSIASLSDMLQSESSSTSSARSQAARALMSLDITRPIV